MVKQTFSSLMKEVPTFSFTKSRNCKSSFKTSDETAVQSSEGQLMVSWGGGVTRFARCTGSTRGGGGGGGGGQLMRGVED